MLTWDDQDGPGSRQDAPQRLPTPDGVVEPPVRGTEPGGPVDGVDPARLVGPGAPRHGPLQLPEVTPEAAADWLMDDTGAKDDELTYRRYKLAQHLAWDANGAPDMVLQGDIIRLERLTRQIAQAERTVTELVEQAGRTEARIARRVVEYERARQAPEPLDPNDG